MCDCLMISSHCVQTLRKVQLEMLAVGAPAVMIRLISMSGDKGVVHAAIVASIAMLYVHPPSAAACYLPPPPPRCTPAQLALKHMCLNSPPPL